MKFNKDNNLNYYPNSVSLHGTEVILEQMKNNICKICIDKKIIGIGFFCKIPIKNNLFPILITNNHIIDESLLKKEKILSLLIYNHPTKEIELDNRLIYTNKEYDITIIEIKKEDKIENFLELDNIKRNNKSYIGESIYILKYSRNKNIYVSYGKIIEEKKSNFIYICNKDKDSTCSPILNLANNKIIGIYYKNKKECKYNNGLFLKFIINEIINLNKKKYLLQFNKKYNVNIKDMKVTKLDLSRIEIGNEGLKCLCNINFEELKELYLYDCNISDAKLLEKILKFEKLEILDLGSNILSNNINSLENANFEELKILYLNDNNISDIEFLEKIKFEKLEILNLSDNNISDINVLDRINNKNLKELNLVHNNITDIKIFEKIKFDKLEILNLGDNNISNINLLNRLDFKELKELYLNDNNISEINALEKVKMKKLKILDLGGNKISNINILNRINLKELKELYLNCNEISDINALEQIKLEKLEILNLEHNEIEKNQYYSFLNKLIIKFKIYL